VRDKNIACMDIIIDYLCKAMAPPIKNKKRGVTVKINHDTSEKVIRIIDRTKRSFSAEVNVAIAEYCDRHEVLNNKRDNGR
jgi:low affinity Fe/Cu permease